METSELIRVMNSMELHDTFNLGDLSDNKNFNHIEITKVIKGHIYHFTHKNSKTSVFVPNN